MNSGSTQPETANCALWKAKLDPYLDGELPAKELRAFDAHVRSCASCSADALSRVQTKRAVQAAEKRFMPRQGFRQRVQRSIADRPTPQWRLSWRGAFAGALAALLIAGAVSLGYFSRIRQNTEARLQETTYNEIADLHVATLASSAPVDVISTNRHTVQPWFQGRIPFAFNLPELQNSDFSLLGGRVTYLQQAPGAHLVYELRKHKISVLIFQIPSGNEPQTSPVSTKAASFSTETWSADGLRYFVIGDAGEDDIHKLAEMFKAAAHG